MAEPRWLEPDEDVAWRSFVLATRLLWSQLERDLQRDAQLALTHYEILGLLAEMPGHALSLSELALLLQVSPSRLSHALARLEETTWIRREMDGGDRRKWKAVLTEPGMAALREAAPAHVESVRTHVLDALTPAQVAQLGDISRALLAHLAPGFDPAEAMARCKEGVQPAIAAVAQCTEVARCKEVEQLDTDCLDCPSHDGS
jgi:DNA-binding MarR family transcriptional regulator